MLRKSSVSPPTTCNRVQTLPARGDCRITPLEPEAQTMEVGAPPESEKCATLIPRRLVSTPDVCTTQTGVGDAAGTSRKIAVRRIRMARILSRFRDIPATRRRYGVGNPKLLQRPRRIAILESTRVCRITSQVRRRA